MPRWKPMTDADYLSKLRGRSVITTSGCWEHQSFRRPSKRMNNQAQGYADVSYRGKTWRAHRLAYVLAKGPVPAGMVVSHVCDNPPCCNPDHLVARTEKGNMRDAVAKGRLAQQRKTHCKHGHEYTPENTFRPPSAPQKRNCKTCQRIRHRLNSGWPPEKAVTLPRTPHGYRPVAGFSKRHTSQTSEHQEKP